MTSQRKPFQFSLSALLIVVTISGCYFSFLGLACRRVDAKGLTAQQANEALGTVLSNISIPPEAKQVDIHARFMGGESVEFDIAEGSFLDWAKQRSWPVKRIDRNVEHVSSWPSAWPPNTTDAWYFSNSSHRGGWTVAYDRRRCRAYVHYSAR